MMVKDLMTYSLEDIQEVVILSKHISEDADGVFKIKPFINLKYKDVIGLKQLAMGKAQDNELIESVAILNGFDYSLKKLTNSTLKSYFRTINEIESNFKKIASYEKMLQTSSDAKLINAGIDSLSQFGDLNVIDALAGGDILKWKDVLDLEWWDVFNKLLKNKTEDKIRRNLEKK
tara:strand:- start:1744 stop:2268 length:525 start_codon:yes stop_codon:yes gene_type:complete